MLPNVLLVHLSSASSRMPLSLATLSDSGNFVLREAKHWSATSIRLQSSAATNTCSSTIHPVPGRISGSHMRIRRKYEKCKKCYNKCTYVSKHWITSWQQLIIYTTEIVCILLTLIAELVFLVLQAVLPLVDHFLTVSAVVLPPPAQVLTDLCTH